jgi:hypothetical protein
MSYSHLEASSSAKLSGSKNVPDKNGRYFASRCECDNNNNNHYNTQTHTDHMAPCRVFLKESFIFKNCVEC